MPLDISFDSDVSRIKIHIIDTLRKKKTHDVPHVFHKLIFLYISLLCDTRQMDMGGLFRDKAGTVRTP